MGTANNGNDTVNGNWTYGYDPFNRLASSNKNSGQQTYSYVYDRFGNRWQQNAPQGGSQFIARFTGNNPGNPQNNNRMDSYSYDAAGNLLNDGVHSYTFDAESRITKVDNGSTATYTYDGNGLRVKKCLPNCTSPTSRTVYIFSGTKVIAEYDNGAAVGSASREYIYSDRQRLATIDSSGTKYQHPDHLSTRVSTDANGTVVRTYGHRPFGETWYESGTASKSKFTSYERDPETNNSNDYAMARTYMNRLGRFSSPDPLVHHLADPQSLNLYRYVRNDPVNMFDPLGLCGCEALAKSAFPGPAGNATAGGGACPNAGGGGGGADFAKLKAQAFKALLNPACSALFGDIKNAVTALFGSSYKMYSPGQANPFPHRISSQGWTDMVNSFAQNPDRYARTFWSSSRPGGITFFTSQFTNYDPGFPPSPDGFSQMTGFFHELEHAASHNKAFDEAVDASTAAYDADYLKINTNCTPTPVETQSAPVTGELTPP